MPTTLLQPLIWGTITFVIAIPIIYFMTNEINWKFALWLAIGTTIGRLIGILI
ncbi:hypothetical protein ACT9XH_12090 [Methanococcoides methylutens]|uniref:hypothetical protein n=1 Tax=Methanococcoides methylutens TaxID=2226 RepID=UPI004044796D